jgi:hypothetical protein
MMDVAKVADLVLLMDDTKICVRKKTTYPITHDYRVTL